MILSDGPNGSFLIRDETGHPIAGGGKSFGGIWCWWSVTTDRKRVSADGRDDAIRRALASIGKGLKT